MAEKLRVLVVDDQIDVADSLVSIVKTWGCETQVVYNGADAIEKATVFRPHVVLLDVMMPGMDGFNVATELRNRCIEVTIVGVTALGDASFRHRGWDTGFNFYMTKPIDPEKLKKVIVTLARTLEIEEKRRQRRTRTA
jgi:DNA-binding response OmpR family regulator